MQKDLTVVIPAYNEEHNIKQAIESAAWAHVYVIAMGHDKTADIAHKMGAKVMKAPVSSPDFRKVQEELNKAIKHTETKWLLRLDADEVITPELKEEIESIINSEHPAVAYGIPRKQYFWGGFLTGGDWAYDRLVRLFQTKYVKYEPIVEVHEQLKVDGDTEYLGNALLHYSHPTLDVAIQKFNTYTTMEAKQLNDPYGNAVLKMIFLPFYIFLRWMIWHQGYKDGLRGLVAGAYRGFYDFMLYSKYLESKKIHEKNK